MTGRGAREGSYTSNKAASNHQPGQGRSQGFEAQEAGSRTDRHIATPSLHFGPNWYPGVVERACKKKSHGKKVGPTQMSSPPPSNVIPNVDPVKRWFGWAQVCADLS